MSFNLLSHNWLQDPRLVLFLPSLLRHACCVVEEPRAAHHRTIQLSSTFRQREEVQSEEHDNEFVRLQSKRASTMLELPVAMQNNSVSGESSSVKDSAVTQLGTVAQEKEAFNNRILHSTAHRKVTEESDGGGIMQDDEAAAKSSGGEANSAEVETQCAGEKSLSRSTARAAEHSPDNASETKHIPESTLVDIIVSDILKALGREGQTKECKRQGKVDQGKVHSVLKKRRNYWRRHSDLPKAEWKVLFRGKVVQRLEEASGWLLITNHKSNWQRPAEAEQKAEQVIPQASQDAMDIAPMSNTTTEELTAQTEDEPYPPMYHEGQDNSNEGAHVEEEGHKATVSDGRNGTGELDSPPHQLDENPQPHTANQPVSCWSFLDYGPHYKKEGFQFDNWDTMDNIDQIISSDEEELSTSSSSSSSSYSPFSPSSSSDSYSPIRLRARVEPLKPLRRSSRTKHCQRTRIMRQTAKPESLKTLRKCSRRMHCQRARRNSMTW